MIDIREVQDNKVLMELPALEREIWGNSDPVPSSLLKVMVDHGGMAWVAQDSDLPGRWVGFVMALPARDNQGWYLHSHQTGVIPSYQGLGIGRALKFKEMAWAISHGLERVGWTFDPLRASNAYFNLEVLGATITRYLPNYYGELTSSLNRGLPTDRVFCEWDLRQPTPEGHGQQVEIPVPRDIGVLKERDMTEARAWQLRVRTLFLESLEKGYRPIGFLTEPHPHYVLCQT